MSTSASILTGSQDFFPMKKTPEMSSTHLTYWEKIFAMHRKQGIDTLFLQIKFANH